MNTLTKIARDMRQLVEPVQRGYVHRILFGGLHVVLEHRDATWRLAIARINKPPSATEAATVGRDFGIPAGTEWTYAQRPVKVNVGRSQQPKLKYQVLECTWIERDSPSTTKEP